MRLIFTLSSCDTSRKILKQIPLDGFTVVDIKKEGISESDLNLMKSLSKSYESLFSRRSRNYSKMGLKDKVLSEEDYRSLIRSDYTFLKRPVIIDGEHIFIGNQKANIENLIRHFKLNNGKAS